MSYKSGMFCSRKVDLSRTRVTNALLVMWIYGMLTHTIEGDPTQAGLEMGVDVVGCRLHVWIHIQRARWHAQPL